VDEVNAAPRISARDHLLDASFTPTKASLEPLASGKCATFIERSRGASSVWPATCRRLPRPRTGHYPRDRALLDRTFPSPSRLSFAGDIDGEPCPLLVPHMKHALPRTTDDVMWMSLTARRRPECCQDRDVG
jgi:hypothetical protein